MYFMADEEMQSYRSELIIPGTADRLAHLLPVGRLQPTARQYDDYVVACLADSGARLVEATVTDLARDGDGLLLTLADAAGESVPVRARRVVLATGSRPVPPPPEWERCGAVSYDRVYAMDAEARVEALRGRRAVVVGSGNSALQTALLVAGAASDTLVLVNRYVGQYPFETSDRFAWRARSTLACELVAKSATTCRSSAGAAVCLRMLVYQDLRLEGGPEDARLTVRYHAADNEALLTRGSLPGRCEHAVASTRGEGAWQEHRALPSTFVVWAVGSEPVYPPSSLLTDLPRLEGGHIRSDDEGRTEVPGLWLTGACRGQRSVNEMTPAGAVPAAVPADPPGTE
jgi:hypothetical protein